MNKNERLHRIDDDELTAKNRKQIEKIEKNKEKTEKKLEKNNLEKAELELLEKELNKTLKKIQPSEPKKIYKRPVKFIPFFDFAKMNEDINSNHVKREKRRIERLNEELNPSDSVKIIKENEKTDEKTQKNKKNYKKFVNGSWKGFTQENTSFQSNFNRNTEKYKTIEFLNKKFRPGYTSKAKVEDFSKFFIKNNPKTS